LLELMVGEVLHTLPPPRDGSLHLILDTTRQEKTGEKQPLAYTTKTGKFEPYRFGHSVVRVPAAARRDSRKNYGLGLADPATSHRIGGDGHRR
jgi:hypothetical protein